MDYYKRNLENLLEKTLKTRPLVYLNGPRQCGKSTLVKNLYLEKEQNYISFDSPINLFSAKNDPASFINSLPNDKINIIDEVQLVPEIYPYLKMEVDKHREKGNGTELFLLTGSANLMALPALAEALVGRMSTLTLLPFSSGEHRRTGLNFIKRLFEEKLEYHSYDAYNLLELIENATFPEAALNPDIEREQWFGDYLNTLIQRDVRTIADIRDPAKMIMLFSFLAMRAGGLLNNSKIAQEIGIDIKTYERYKAAAVNTFILFEIKAWAKPGDLNKRFTKSPKLYFTDTNLLLYLLRRGLKDIFDNDRTMMGHLLENYIASEIIKNASSISRLEISHFRTSDQKEVDFVLEKDNEVVGIEVKLNSTPNENDFTGLKFLKETVSKRFKLGIVFYTGTAVVPFGEDLWAVHVCYLYV